MSGTERSKRYRARRQQGIVMVAQVEITEAMVRSLIAENRLASLDENGEVRVSRLEVGKAIEELLEDWAS